MHVRQLRHGDKEMTFPTTSLRMTARALNRKLAQMADGRGDSDRGSR